MSLSQETVQIYKMSLPAPSIENAMQGTVPRNFLSNCTVVVQPSPNIKVGDILHFGMHLHQPLMFIRTEITVTAEQVTHGVKWQLKPYSHVALPRDSLDIEYSVERASETVGQSEVVRYTAK